MQRRIKGTGHAMALHLDLSDEDFLGEWSTRSLPEDLRALSLRQPSHDFLKNLPEGLDKLSLEFRRLRGRLTGGAPLVELPGSLSELNLDMAGCRSGLMFPAERIPKSVTRLTVDISGCNQAKARDFMYALREALPPSLTLFSLRMVGCKYLFDSGLEHLRERLPSSLTTLALNFDACGGISNEGLWLGDVFTPQFGELQLVVCAHLRHRRRQHPESLRCPRERLGGLQPQPRRLFRRHRSERGDYWRHSQHQARELPVDAFTLPGRDGRLLEIIVLCFVSGWCSSWRFERRLQGLPEHFRRCVRRLPESLGGEVAGLAGGLGKEAVVERLWCEARTRRQHAR